MIEKVNPSHPDKVADRIAGAIVDLAYKVEENPKVAVEVLIGHKKCLVIIESSVDFTKYGEELQKIIVRIGGAGLRDIQIVYSKQDEHLAKNQEKEMRCGDNGIFKGIPLTNEEKKLSKIARDIYKEYPTDGKYILSGRKLVICQSNAKTSDLQKK